MNCVNCGSDAYLVYKGNSLCCWCFELCRLKEIIKFRKIRENQKLVKETQEDIKTARFWVKASRITNDFNYPEVI